jgi:hypothetical protein
MEQTMRHHQILEVINQLDMIACEAGNGFDDHASPENLCKELVDRGVHPVVAREWSNEHDRRDAILDRMIEKQGKKAKGHGVPYRRIIKSIIGVGREFQYHATKGWRSYRIAA